jgi:hypothetical protein
MQQARQTGARPPEAGLRPLGGQERSDVGVVSD